MDGHINISKLGRLLNNLHALTGIKFALMDHGVNEVYTSSYKNDFCACLADTPEGFARCVACDAKHLKTLRPEGMLTYRCHAGLIEAAIPITENGRIVATVQFGQLLSDGDVDKQWEETRALCAWYPDMDRLKRAFYQLRRASERDIRACCEIALACVSEVRFKGLFETATLTDFQRLTLYIDQHYMEKLTLPSLTRALGVGTTKLCSLASREGGATPMQLVAAKRVAVAQGMLMSTALNVYEIAEAVGIPDYNYFAKVFKKHVGLAPHAYRKRYRVKADVARPPQAPRALPLDPDQPEVVAMQ